MLACFVCVVCFFFAITLRDAYNIHEKSRRDVRISVALFSFFVAVLRVKRRKGEQMKAELQQEHATMG